MWLAEKLDWKGLIESTVKILNILYLLAHLHNAVPIPY
jgi:hypothetical protein